MSTKDALELELRQLPGVWFVSFTEDEGTTVIELAVRPGTEQAKVRDEAARSAVNHLEGPAEIRVLEPPREQLLSPRGERVRLVLVLPSDGGASIEVQLARGPQRYASRALAGDTTSVGRAVIEALRGVGAHAPFDVVGFHALPSDWGAGCWRSCGTPPQENCAAGWHPAAPRQMPLRAPCWTPSTGRFRAPRRPRFLGAAPI